MINAIHIPHLRIADVCFQQKLLYVFFYVDKPPFIKINNISAHKVISCDQNLSCVQVFDIPDSKKYTITCEGRLYPLEINRYVQQKSKFTLSTQVKNEDEYIIPWIKFHKSIGFDHFVIYDNHLGSDPISWTSSSQSSNLSKVLSPFLDSGEVTLINWPIPKRVRGKVFGQACHQTHSLYTFNNASYICYTDIDEYINLKKHKNINDLMLDLEKKNEPFDSVSFESRLFYNPHNHSTKGNDFLHISTCGPLLGQARRKSMVKPKLISSYAIHEPSCTHKKHVINKHQAYINHYFFLNKNYRGKDNAEYFDKSILEHII